MTLPETEAREALRIFFGMLLYIGAMRVFCPGVLREIIPDLRWFARQVWEVVSAPSPARSTTPLSRESIIHIAGFIEISANGRRWTVPATYSDDQCIIHVANRISRRKSKAVEVQPPAAVKVKQ